MCLTIILYNNYVTTYMNIGKKKRTSYSSSMCKHWLPVSILLCGDIHPCPGPVSTNEFSSEYKVFHKRGLNFIHLNVRSLLLKLDDIRLLARKTRAACIGISESWLDDSIFDSEIQIDNYNITRKDRNRHGGGVCFYIRRD